MRRHLTRAEAAPITVLANVALDRAAAQAQDYGARAGLDPASVEWDFVDAAYRWSAARMEELAPGPRAEPEPEIEVVEILRYRCPICPPKYARALEQVAAPPTVPTCAACGAWMVRLTASDDGGEDGGNGKPSGNGSNGSNGHGHTAAAHARAICNACGRDTDCLCLVYL